MPYRSTFDSILQHYVSPGAQYIRNDPDVPTKWYRFRIDEYELYRLRGEHHLVNLFGEMLRANNVQQGQIIEIVHRREPESMSWLIDVKVIDYEAMSKAVGGLVPHPASKPKPSIEHSKPGRFIRLGEL